MQELTSGQRRRLRALAHHLEPVCFVGKQGVTEAVVAAIDAALEDHELLKVRFVAGKEEKRAFTDEIAAATSCAVVGLIGHVAVLYRQNPDEEKRKIDLGEA